MKWDLTTVNSLYLVAIATTDEVKSLRDLRGRHVEMLRCIRAEAVRVVRERWGLREGEDIDAVEDHQNRVVSASKPFAMRSIATLDVRLEN